ncbi:MAG: hypothetical protein R3C15_16425 [Thermoleophilia bacterium]
MTDAAPALTRDDLVRTLAEVSHASWQRQKRRQLSGEDTARPSVDDPTPTAHDVERAEDVVAKLEELGLWPQPR